MKRAVRNSKNQTGPHVGIRRAKTEPRGVLINSNDLTLPTHSTDPTQGVKRSISFKETDVVKTFSSQDPPTTCGKNYDPTLDDCADGLADSDDDLNFSFSNKLDLSNLNESKLPNKELFNLSSPKRVEEKVYRMEFNYDNTGRRASSAAERCMDTSLWLKCSSFNFQKKSLHGLIVVRKVDPERRVTVRYTIDDWKTSKDVDAEEASHVRQSDISLETFAFDLNNLDIQVNTVLQFCLRYIAGCQEFWDSNDGNNFAITFRDL